MAEWNWHVALARKVMKHVKVNNEFAFIIGALLPDTPWTDLSAGETLRFRLHMSRLMDNSVSGVADVAKFLDEYSAKLTDSDIYKGWLTHLILDNKLNCFWNMTHYMDNYDLYFMYIGDDVPYTTDQIAKAKWEDLSLYASERFGEQVSYFKGLVKDELGEEDKYVLIDVIGISDSTDLDAIRTMAPDTMSRMCEHTISETMVPVGFYDMVHEDAVRESIRIIKFAEYISEGLQ